MRYITHKREDGEYQFLKDHSYPQILTARCAFCRLSRRKFKARFSRRAPCINTIFDIEL